MDIFAIFSITAWVILGIYPIYDSWQYGIRWPKSEKRSWLDSILFGLIVFALGLVGYVFLPYLSALGAIIGVVWYASVKTQQRPDADPDIQVP